MNKNIITLLWGIGAIIIAVHILVFIKFFLTNIRWVYISLPIIGILFSVIVLGVVFAMGEMIYSMFKGFIPKEKPRKDDSEEIIDQIVKELK